MSMGSPSKLTNLNAKLMVQDTTVTDNAFNSIEQKPMGAPAMDSL